MVLRAPAVVLAVLTLLIASPACSAPTRLSPVSCMRASERILGESFYALPPVSLAACAGPLSEPVPDRLPVNCTKCRVSSEPCPAACQCDHCGDYGLPCPSACACTQCARPGQVCPPACHPPPTRAWTAVRRCWTCEMQRGHCPECNAPWIMCMMYFETCWR